ncbi:MAG TPA: DUF362 domain-containing protein [Candidatus Omnitrophota bacterium]|jgi:uncharacterized Fe-S center protein|nr:DUF362 domain-containing protein [Candidatus Omnitrophota bacterium]HPN55301.1 DUF362 domain-containing protein [Candidatus Omnitrophota bacterium]
MVTSRVYYEKVDQADSSEVIQQRFRRLLDASGILVQVKPRDQVVMKLHFGEAGNTGFIKPEWVRVISQKIKERQAVPVMAETNTLYRGQRTNSKDHLALAARHGFTLEKAGAGIIIPEDSPDNVMDVSVEQPYIKVAKVIKLFLEADVLVSLAHFKGHLMTGFGGALKNIGMGCASREGKLAQHGGVAPFVDEGRCVGCGECAVVCPADAIALEQKRAFIDGELCIGCASCIAACPQEAIDVPWEAGGETIQEKMVEYAKAVLDARQGKTVFVNFAVKITKECDCLAKDDPRICPDIGLFASLDPVSVDKACYDQVMAASGRDVLREAHPHCDGMKQLLYAQRLGLGRMDYTLILVE